MSRFSFTDNLTYAGCAKLPVRSDPNYGLIEGSWCIDGSTLWVRGRASVQTAIGELTLPVSLAPQGTPYASLPICTHVRWIDIASPFDQPAYSPNNGYYYMGMCRYKTTHLLVNREMYYNNNSGVVITQFATPIDGVSPAYGGWSMSGRYHNQQNIYLAEIPSWLQSRIPYTHVTGAFDRSIISLGNRGPSIYAFTPDEANPGALANTALIDHSTIANTYPECGGGMPLPFMGKYRGWVYNTPVFDNYETNGCVPGGVAFVRSGDAEAAIFSGMWARGSMFYHYNYLSDYARKFLLAYSISDIQAVAAGTIPGHKLYPYSYWDVSQYMVEDTHIPAPDYLPSNPKRTLVVTRNGDASIGILEMMVDRSTRPPVIHIFNIT